MSSAPDTIQYPPRVLATVEFLTWEPSQPGNINTTRKQTAIVKVWVHHPLDERYQIDNRGGEEAVKVTRSAVERQHIEWLGLMGLQVDLNEKESAIVNQPKDTISDMGLSSVDSLPEPGPGQRSRGPITLVDR